MKGRGLDTPRPGEEGYWRPGEEGKSDERLSLPDCLAPDRPVLGVRGVDGPDIVLRGYTRVKREFRGREANAVCFYGDVDTGGASWFLALRMEILLEMLPACRGERERALGSGVASFAAAVVGWTKDDELNCHEQGAKGFKKQQ